MKPSLPSCPSGSEWIRKIDPSWFRRLLACVEWAMENPTGDGSTIIKNPGGTLSARKKAIGGAVSGGTASAEYAGYFKVIDVPKVDGSAAAQIKIIDGANPAGVTCGATDLISPIPVATLTKVKPASVWIVASRNAVSGSTEVGFQVLPFAPSGNVGYIEIAKIATDGTIRQMWLNNRIVFRAEYLI